VPAAPSLDHAAAERNRVILIADDNRDGADTLARMLRIMGHETHTVYDGQQAVQTAESLRPEVILLDIGMPKMNGHDAARHIRQQPWGKDVLLIALTGWGREEDRRRTQEVGFDHHLVKPVDAKALLALLSELPVS
jgi:CheY-like chemotaxis protein